MKGETEIDKITNYDWPWVSRYEPLLADFILMGQKLYDLESEDETSMSSLLS
jgi:hypothetical protein